jgi:hypothetical protein
MSEHVLRTETTVRDDLTFRVTQYVDVYPDLSLMGEYTSQRGEPFAIDRRTGQLYGDDSEIILAEGLPRDLDWRTYPYFLPTALADHQGSWNHVPRRVIGECWKRQSAAMARYGIRSSKKTLDLDILAAVRDYERMEAYNKGDWCMTIVQAALIVDGDEVARSCVGGVESDAGEEAFREIVDTLIADVLSSPHSVADRLEARAIACIQHARVLHQGRVQRVQL